MDGFSFISTNPAIGAFDSAEDRQDKRNKQQRDLGVDAAVRGGVSDMLGSQPQQQQPQAAPDYQTPPTVAPPQPDPQPQQPANNSVLASNAANLESGGNPAAVNPGGYSGKYQFGKGALVDAGIYQPAPGESTASRDNAAPWQGTFNIPGHGQMSYRDFLNNGAAQDAAWQAHVQQMDREIEKRGLSSYYGQTIAGVPINENTVRGMIQGGGAAGTHSFITSNGTYNPADANGTTIADFGRKIGAATVQGAPPGVAPVPPASAGGPGYTAPPATPTSAFMPGMGTSRYDPILARLSQTPGGGAAALTLLQSQGKFDQSNYRRTDAYQRLAMSALAHGDPTTARFYAELGGIQLPEHVFSNQNNMVLVGRGGTLGRQFYSQDPDQGQRFVTAYLQSGGDVQAAFTAAGVPRHQPGVTLAWVQQTDGTLKAMAADRGTGTMTPFTTPDQQPVVAAPKPMQQHLKWVQQPDNSQLAYSQNPQDGSLTPVVGPDGKQLSQAARPVAGTLTLDHKVAMMEGTGMSHAEAVAAATGQALKPASVVGAYTKLRTTLDASIDGIGMSEPDKQARIASTMDTMFGQGRWQQAMGSVTPAPAVTAPAAPTAPAAGYQAPPAAPPPTPPTGTATPAATATQGTGGPKAAPTAQDVAATIAQARSALARGAPRAAVIQRLQQNGIAVPGDL